MEQRDDPFAIHIGRVKLLNSASGGTQSLTWPNRYIRYQCSQGYLPSVFRLMRLVIVNAHIYGTAVRSPPVTLTCQMIAVTVVELVGQYDNLERSVRRGSSDGNEGAKDGRKPGAGSRQPLVALAGKGAAGAVFKVVNSTH